MSESSQFVTREEFDTMKEELRELKVAVRELGERMDAGFERIDARLEQVDARFEQVDARFERSDARSESRAERLRTELFDQFEVLALELRAHLDEQLKAGLAAQAVLLKQLFEQQHTALVSVLLNR